MKQSRVQIEINGRKYHFKCPYRENCGKKRIEFSKIAVALITLFCMGCIAANYILAFLEKTNVNAEVTIALIQTILGTVFGYLVKAGFENVFKIKKSKGCESDGEL